MRHTNRLENLSVFILKLPDDINWLRVTSIKDCDMKSAHGIVPTTTIHQLNVRDQQVFDGKMNKIQLSQKNAILMRPWPQWGFTVLSNYGSFCPAVALAQIIDFIASYRI